MTKRINPYITLDGKASEAIAFYREAIGAEVIAVQTFDEMPSDPPFTLPEEARDRILHALLKIGDTNLMLSDTFPGQPQQTSSHVSIAIVISNENESRKVFETLSTGGKVIMPLQKTFWSGSFGMLIDKFDVQWQVSTEEK